MSVLLLVMWTKVADYGYANRNNSQYLTIFVHFVAYAIRVFSMKCWELASIPT